MAGRFPQLTINILYVDLLPLSAISKKRASPCPGDVLTWHYYPANDVPSPGKAYAFGT